MKFDKMPLSCEEARDLMFDYLDGELSERDTERLLQHIDNCDECKTELSERRKVLRLIGEVELSVPVSLRETVMRSIESVPQDNKILTPKKKFFIPWGTIAAACAVVMIMIAGRGAIGIGRSADMVEEGDLSLLRVNSPNQYSAHDTYAAGGAEPYAVFDEGIDASYNDAMNGEEVVFETTASALMLSPSVTTSLNQSTVESPSISPLDNLLVSVSGDTMDHAILLAYASDAAGLAPDGDIDHITRSGYKVTRYTIDNDAEVTFSGYIELFEKKKIDYRAIVPSDAEFDTCEVWLLEADPEDTILAQTKGIK